jgi:hypothetical protein
MTPEQAMLAKIARVEMADPPYGDADVGQLKLAPLRVRRFGLWVWPHGPDVELNGYWNLQDLVARLAQNTFPFEQAIVRCMLFVAALDEQDLSSAGEEEKRSMAAEQKRRLVGVARMLCGLIHDHAKRDLSKELFSQRGLKITKEELDNLDGSFFSRIGGPGSLLFSPNIQDLYIELNKRIDELLIPLSIAHYFECLGWTFYRSSIEGAEANFLSMIKQLGKLRCAYSAIDKNVFGFDHDFKASKNSESTVLGYRPEFVRPHGDSIRTRLRKAPRTVLLLYHMLGWTSSIADDWSFPHVFCDVLMSKTANRRLAAALAASKRNIMPLLEPEHQSVREWLSFSDASEWNDQHYHRAPLSHAEIERLHKELSVPRGRPRKQLASDKSG